MELPSELDAFVEQMIEKFERVGTGFRGSYLEKYISKHLKSVYIQCLYIVDRLDKSIILENQIEHRKGNIVFRKAEILKKLFFNKEFKEGGTENVFMLFKDNKVEISPEEFMDIMIDSISLMVEHFVFLIQKKKIFDLSKLATSLGFDSSFVSSVCKQNNLEELFNKLAEETNNNYNSKTAIPIFSMQEYKLRCSCFHGDYEYKKENGEVFITLNEQETDKISLKEIALLSLDLVGKLNTLPQVTYFFSIEKLPLKRFKKLE